MAHEAQRSLLEHAASNLKDCEEEVEELSGSLRSTINNNHEGGEDIENDDASLLSSSSLDPLYALKVLNVKVKSLEEELERVKEKNLQLRTITAALLGKRLSFKVREYNI